VPSCAGAARGPGGGADWPGAPCGPASVAGAHRIDTVRSPIILMVLLSLYTTYNGVFQRANNIYKRLTSQTTMRLIKQHLQKVRS